MASTRRTRKDISQSQRDMLISLWETKDFKLWGSRWRELPKQTKQVWKEKAKTFNSESSMPPNEMDGNMKKKLRQNAIARIIQACGELEEIGVAVGGMAFVNDTFNAFGSRDVRPYFLEPSVQSGFIEILHCGKGETMHKSNGRMPYAKINEFSITGMPCGIPFRNPGSYGPVDCQKIIDEQENIIIMKRGNLELAENNLVLLVTTEECENEEH
ncbi:unnamed protein product [Clavelina lepadiformis]|uniref:Uncharacterized protein n=1 Tax=Clavelina lepadiformis TaxID=159417 RepID=A0ABP0GD40_CLALP